MQRGAMICLYVTFGVSASGFHLTTTGTHQIFPRWSKRFDTHNERQVGAGHLAGHMVLGVQRREA